MDGLEWLIKTLKEKKWLFIFYQFK